MIDVRKRLGATLALAGFAALAAAQQEEDMRDLVRLRGGKEVRGRVIERYDPEHVILRQGGSREAIERSEVDLIVVTVRDQLRKFLGARREGLTLDEEWALVGRAESLGLPAMARLQAYHVLALDPGHVGAHQHLGHEEKNGRWRWLLDGRHYDAAEFHERIRDWKNRLILRGEHFELQTNAGLRRAVDTLFDLEHLYLYWLDTFGETLRACEDVDDPLERMTFLVYRSKDDPGFKDYVTQEREAYVDASLQTTTVEGNPNVAYTYYVDGEYRPHRLFDLGVEQLMYSTLYLGHDRGGFPESTNDHLSHWVELGLGYWLGRQFGGSPGYPRHRPFELEPEEARLALLRPTRSPLDDYQEEITNLVGLEFRQFYGTGDREPIHRAKARTLVAFMMEANVPLESRGREVGHTRDGLMYYLREVYGTPRSHSSSALDDGLGARVEQLEVPWKEWVAAQL